MEDPAGLSFIYALRDDGGTGPYLGTGSLISGRVVLVHPSARLEGSDQVLAQLAVVDSDGRLVEADTVRGAVSRGAGDIAVIELDRVPKVPIASMSLAALSADLVPAAVHDFAAEAEPFSPVRLSAPALTNAATGPSTSDDDGGGDVGDPPWCILWPRGPGCHPHGSAPS